MPGRIRTLKPEVFELLGELDDSAFRLLMGLKSMADDYGNLPWFPGRVAGAIWWSGAPWARESLQGFDATAERLVSVGLVQPYSHGRLHVHVAGWEVPGQVLYEKVKNPSLPRCPGPEAEGSQPVATLSVEPTETLRSTYPLDPIRSEPIRTDLPAPASPDPAFASGSEQKPRKARPKRNPSPEALALADRLRQQLVAQKPDHLLSDDQTWARRRPQWGSDFDLLLVQDRRLPLQVTAVVDWLFGPQCGTGARFVVESPGNLRGKYDRIEQSMRSTRVDERCAQSGREAGLKAL